MCLSPFFPSKNQVTTYTWCTCGGLASLKDAKNNNSGNHWQAGCQPEQK